VRRIAIDTNIYAAFKSNAGGVVELFKNCDYIGIDITVIAELFSGFALGSREKKNRRELEAFLNTPRVDILGHTIETAEYYAVVIKQLKAGGKPIPTNDIWIAASAMQHGLTLVTFDRHFEAIRGLLVISKADVQVSEE
jgi:tRNA(fMet)-specific endonuclease VapC